MADKIVVLNAGMIAQVGSPLELYHRPNNLFVATFIGSPKMNLIEGRVEGVVNGNARIQLASGSMIEVPTRGTTVAMGPVTLGVRPEHLLVGKTGAVNSFKGKVQLSEHLGGETMLYVSAPDIEQCVIKADGLAPQRAGDEITVELAPQTCHLFDVNGQAIVNGSLI